MKDKKNQPLIKLGDEAQQDILTGIKLMYDAVTCTLSPKGRNVALKVPWGYPIIVHDGVTVAKEVKSRDHFVQIGIDIIKEAAQKTNEEAGDGTTTSILLAYELITRGMKLKEQGINPMVLREELNVAMGQALSKLDKLAKPVKSKADLIKIATVASANPDLGKMVGDAAYDMGADGLVTVEESGGYDTWVDRTAGMSLDKGYASPYFVTDPYRMEATIKKPVVIVTDKNITTNKEIFSIIEHIVGGGKKDIVIVGDVAGEALSTLVANKMKGIINCVVISPPGHGENRAGYLEDIAIMTGGEVISKELGMELDEFVKNFDDGYLGKCDKVIVDAKASLFVKGAGKKKDVKSQVEGLKELRKNASDKPLIEVYDERIAKLTAGVAVIRVGAKTEAEGREKIERVKDAVGAAQAALSEGYVTGSGATFLRLAKAVNGNTDGDKLLREALEQPLRKVMENCGEPNTIINSMVEMIRNDSNTGVGYEAMSGQVINLLDEGIIDPVKVIRLCIENGVGVATSMLTTEVLVDFNKLNPEV